MRTETDKQNTSSGSFFTEEGAAGVAGMVLIILALGAEDQLAAVDMRAPLGQNLILYPESGVNANPHVSAKILWAQSVKDMRIVTSMALAKIFSSQLACNRFRPDSDTIRALRASVNEMAAESCALDKDESDAMFDSCRNYVERIFSHPGVRQNIVPFGRFLLEKGISDREEIIEYLETVGLAR